MDKATMSVSQTAEYIGVGRNQMYNLIKLNQVPYIKFGKQIRVPIKALESWLLEKSMSVSQ